MQYTGDKVFDRTLFTTLTITAYILSLAKYQKRAPYGKFGGNEKTVNLNAKFGWWLMELPATLSFLYNYYQGRQRKLARDDKILRRRKERAQMALQHWFCSRYGACIMATEDGIFHSPSA